MNRIKFNYRKFKSLFFLCKKSESDFFVAFIRNVVIKILYKKDFFLHQHVTLKGINNIEVSGLLKIGIDYFGFLHKKDKTLLNIQGKLIIKGDYSIGRGCRFDIAQNAILSIGYGGYISPNTNFIIMHGLKIGNNCIISWDCQFLDEDFHEITYEGKKERNKNIEIGNNVWIGCGVKIYKGVKIPDNTIIAANSIVKSVFNFENTLIGGNPAIILKSDINWS